MSDFWIEGYITTAVETKDLFLKVSGQAVSYFSWRTLVTSLLATEVFEEVKAVLGSYEQAVVCRVHGVSFSTKAEPSSLLDFSADFRPTVIKDFQAVLAA